MNGFSQTLVVARREIVERVRTRAFRIATALLVVVAAAGVIIPSLLAGEEEPYQIVVAGPQPAGLEAALQEAAGPRAVELVSVADRDAADAALRDDAAVALVDGEELRWFRDADPRLQAVMTAALTELAVGVRADALGLSPTEMATLLEPVALHSTSLEPTLEGQGPRVVIAWVALLLTFMAITMYGAYVMTGVVEEKSTRVVEVVLSRVRPRELLAGKVLGIGSVGVLQLAVTLAVVTTALLITRPPDLPPSVWTTIPALVLWFVLGFAFYSVVYGALGSLASRPEDAQAVVAPLTIVLTGAYMLAIAAVAQPGAGWVSVASVVPGFAPLLMPLRLAMTGVPWWQTLVAVTFQLAAIWVTINLGGRLYRGAVLKLGPRVGLREAWRASA